MKAMKKIISALPWVLAVIAIIAAVAVFVYADRAVIDYDTEVKVAELQKSNTDMQSTVDSLKSNIDSLQSTVKSLQEELDSKYSNDGQRWEMEYKAKRLEQLIDAMPADDPDAIDVMAYYLFDRGRLLIKYMGDAEFRAHNFVEPAVEITKNGFTYSKCDISYSDAEKYYSEVFTGNALKNFMRIRFTEADGDLYAIPGGGSSGFGTENVRLTRIDKTKDEIKYKVSYVHTFNGGFEDAGSCTMSIKLVNGGWRISEIDYMERYWSYEELYWRPHTE